MTSPSENPISAIEALLAERQRYEGWMATLETRRDITPAHVYERVRADYETRLREVLARLSGRSTELRDMVTTLATRVSALEGDETAKRDALAEAELRALVGEYEPDEWERIRRERDEEIERIRSQRQGLGGELQKVQELLTAADAEPRIATPAPGVQVASAAPEPAVAGSAASAAPAAPEQSVALPVSEEPEPAYAAATTEAPEAPVPPAPAAADGGGSFDELAFLQSVVDAPRPEAAAPPAPRPRAEEMGDVARTLAADLGGRPGESAAPAPRTTSPAMHRMANPVPNPTGTPASGSQPVVEPRQPAGGDAARRTDSVPAFLRDVPQEQAKTLKCQECGTMNYPTEWYCERCGGELAAM